MKDIRTAILIFSIALPIQLILIVVFATLQAMIDPRDQPQEFSIIPGGDIQNRHLGEVCDNIELNISTPNVITTAYIYRTRNSNIATATTKLEQIFLNNILEVGYNSGQLTYYGIPVARNDEMRLNISSSEGSLNSLSVTISVYEAEGFSQLLDYISQDVDPLSRYNLHSCLLDTGCVVDLEAEFNGWLYVVFDSSPTPTTLDVSLEATLREYDIDSVEIRSKCTLSELSPRCNLEVPTHVTDLPFFIVYHTAPLSYSPLPSQSLNVSVVLTSTCTRSYYYTYVVLGSILCVTSIISAFVLIGLVCEVYGRPMPSMNGCRDTYLRCNHYRTTRNMTDISLETIPSPTVEKDHDVNESLPSYEKAIEI